MNPVVRTTLIVVVTAATAFGLTHLFLRPVTGEMDEIAWIRAEFDLTPAQTSAIEKLHEDYHPVCMEHCKAIMQARQRLASANDKSAAQAEIARLETVCHDATLAHLKRVAAVMPPDQAARFLSLVVPKISGQSHDMPMGLK